MGSLSGLCGSSLAFFAKGFPIRRAAQNAVVPAIGRSSKNGAYCTTRMIGVVWENDPELATTLTV